MAEPRGFVVVGDTDWWASDRRSVQVALDSTLRKVRSSFWSSGQQGVVSAGSRSIGSTPIYARVRITEGSAVNTIGFGLVPATQSTYTTLHTASGNAFFYNGNIYVNGSSVQSGLGSLTAGDALGVEIYDDSGTPKVQFWKNGSTLGSAHTIADSEYSLAAQFGAASLALTLDTDAKDLADLPSDAQPWGAAARVADRGGYSPGATVLDPARVSSAGLTIDAFRRTVTGVADGSWRAVGAVPARVAGTARRLVYFEVLNESAGTSTHGGLNRSTDAALDAYVGNTAESWGCSSLTGATWHSGASNATGAVTWGAGKRLGVLWDSVNSIWFLVDGVLIGGGDPEANTGARYTNVTGSVQPAVSQLGSTAGRARLCTHAREQLYRPSYAEAWDGADLLPEQHFADRLKRAPSVRREVSYYPWANQRNRGAAIGNLDLNNADGEFDALSEYDLRDQSIIAYRVRDDGSTVREFTGLVDGVTQPDARTCRIAVADVSAKLDVRVAAKRFAVGSVLQAPVEARIGTTLTSDVCQEPRSSFFVYDRGLEVTSFSREDSEDGCGFRRTVNPAGLQSVYSLNVFRVVEAIAVPNQDLTLWTGTAPNSWDTAVAGTASVARDGVNDRLTVDSGNNVAVAAFQANFVSGKRYSVQIEYTAYNNAWEIALWASDSAADAFAGTGQNLGDVAKPAGAASGIVTLTATIGISRTYGALRASGTGSIKIESVRVWEVGATDEIGTAVDYLVDQLGAAVVPYSFGLTASTTGSFRDNTLGDYSAEQPTIRAMIDAAVESQLMDYYPDASGTLQFVDLVAPEDVTTVASGLLGSIAESDIYGEMTVADDYAPRLTDRARFNRNFALHTDEDIAGAVSTDERQRLTSEGPVNQLDVSSATNSYDARAFHPFYSFAVNGPIWERTIRGELIDTPDPLATDSDIPLWALHRAYAKRRRFYRFRLSREKFDELALRPGGVCEVTHRRYGLSAGKNLMCVAIEPQLMSPTVAVTFWG